MKKLIITCMLLTGASMVSFAQDNSPSNGPARPQPIAGMTNAAQMAQHRAAMDVKQYGLAGDQAKTAYNIEFEFISAMDKYKTEGKQPSPVQINNMQATRDQKMKAMMTPEQYKKYETMRGGIATMKPVADPQGK